MKLSENLSNVPDDCHVDIHPGVTVGSCNVVFEAKNCSLEIAEGCHFHELNLFFLSDNSKLRIGRGVLCHASFWAKLSGRGRSITVGDNCLFEGVKLHTSDSHQLVDNASGDVINPSADITIGDHVWIGESVLVLKGSMIGSGAVIEARSTVRESVPENSLAAGSPAKILRKNIAWRYDAINDNFTEHLFAASSKADKSLQRQIQQKQPHKPDEEDNPIPANVNVFWRKLRRHLSKELVDHGDRLAASHWRHDERSDILQKVCFMTDLLAGKHEISLKGGLFKFGQIYDLTVQLEEIICNVQYGFETNSRTPFIIDGGGCYGLASYILNRNHPKAEILIFEPNPENAKIIRENIDRIGINNVSLCEAAVGARNDVVEFYASADMPMGSSTLPRLDPRQYALNAMMVQQVSLPELIADREVDFLKLDVEGSEYSIFEAMDGRMKTIQRMFIELHFGHGLPKSNLTRLLEILDRNGFDYIITRAGNVSPPHPLRASEAVWRKSLNLWARRL